MIVREIVRIPPRVGEVSCVGGLIRTYPVEFGNYFIFWNGPYCVNMWAENLEELVKRGGLEGDLEVEVFYHDHTPNIRFARVVDPRVPSNWLNQRPCFTGSVSRLSHEDWQALVDEVQAVFV